MSALLLIGVAALIALNGFFVAAEFALVRSRRSRLEALRRESARGADLALKQIERIDEYLSACQLGITMASLGIGFLGEPAIADLLVPALGNVAGEAAAWAIAITIAYVLVTAAHITVGEQVPKIYAITHAEGTARRVAGPLRWFNAASRPLIWALNNGSNAILRLVGTEPRADFAAETSGEDLRLLISESAVAGRLATREASMLSGVLVLGERQARHVMTPFHAVVTVGSDATVTTALDRALDSGHTRLVAIDGREAERVLGLVHVNSLVRLLREEGGDAPIRSAIKPSPIVPETKRLESLLSDLQRERTTVAVVVDEYGVPAGIVTVEDIIEEVVGEIADELDPVTTPIRQLANGDWFVRGEVSLADLAQRGIELVEPDATPVTSVGGFVFAALGRRPVTGDIVTFDGYSVRVESVRGTRVEAVRIRRDDATRSA